MALTKGAKVVLLLAVAGGIGGGYMYWKGHHVPAPIEVIDVAPPAAHVEEQQAPAPAASQVQQPVWNNEQEPAASTNASSDRGMQFLLKQGKK